MLFILEKRQSPFLQVEEHVGVCVGLSQIMSLDAVFPKCGVALFETGFH